MSEQSDQITAAATGAAAAVAAVHDEQEEQARSETMAQSAVTAQSAAVEASEAAIAAATAAEAASSEALSASAVAEDAVSTAYNVQDDMAVFRAELRQRDEELQRGIRGLFEEHFKPHGNDNEPTEVVVSNDGKKASDPAAQGGTNPGSGGSAGNPGGNDSSGGTGRTRESARRHKFGNRK